ncbi:hypothetical protein ACFYY2_31295 [Streptomyces sp. NPDC001822]|uniref:hypothetical protein n=1 Tax=Streptomyces sp. NPDC001822 TaxID=3364614 RepID=UPI0036B3C473
MKHWCRSYWAAEDTWFYFEIDADGWVARQVELQGPREKPIAAACLAEWQVAQQAGTLVEYESMFGATAEVPLQEWEGLEPQDLTPDEFEGIWLAARAACREGSRKCVPRGA